MLAVQPNYSKMRIDALLYLFEKINTNAPEKQIVLFDAIIMKYFEIRNQNTKFNLYSYVGNMRRNGLDAKRALAKIMGIELTNGTLNTLPKEHQEAFLSMLICFIELIEKQQEESDGKLSVEWDYTNIPSLLVLLKNLNSSNIKSTVLKQRINLLSKKVEDNYNAKLKEMQEKKEAEQKKAAEQEKNKTALVKTETAVAPVVEIKKLSIAKSKLTKEAAQDILKNIHLYEEKDQKDIINLCLKKWDDSIRALPYAFAYKYFRENKVVHRWVSPLSEIHGLMSNFRYKGNLAQIKAIGFNSLEEMIEEAQEWYMTLEGATEVGCKHFIASLHEAKTDGYREIKPGDYHSEAIMSYLNEMVLEPALEILRKTKGVNLEVVALDKISVEVQNVKPMETGIAEITGINAQGNYIIKERGLTEKLGMSTLAYAWAVFTALQRMIFTYEGHYLSFTDKVDVFNPKYKENAEEFIEILKSYKITGEGLLKLKAVDKGYNSSLSDLIKKAVQHFYCNTIITKEIARDLIGTVEKYLAFATFTYIHSSTGSYHDSYEFLFETLVPIIDEFDFSKKEDTDLFFRYSLSSYGVNKKIGVHRKNLEYDFSIYSKVMQKIEKEVPEVAEMLRNYSDLVGKEQEVMEFLSIYFGVSEHRY